MTGIRGLRGLYFRFLPASIRSLASAAQQPMVVNSYLDQWVKIWDVCLKSVPILNIYGIIYCDHHIFFSWIDLNYLGSSYMNDQLKNRSFRWVCIAIFSTKKFKQFAGLFPREILARAISTEKARDKIIAIAQPAHLPLKKWGSFFCCTTGEVEIKTHKIQPINSLWGGRFCGQQI